MSGADLQASPAPDSTEHGEYADLLRRLDDAADIERFPSVRLTIVKAAEAIRRLTSPPNQGTAGTQETTGAA